VAQFAYNSLKNTTTGVMLFFVNRRQEPTIEQIPIEIKQKSHNGQITAEQMKDFHKILQMNMEFMNSRAKQYYDNRRQEAPLIREGKKVFLLQQNIKTKQPCNKLDYKKLRSFRIREKIRPLNYKLELPETMRIHLIFHVLLLEKAPQNTRQQEVKVEPEIKYEVDRILDHDKINGQEQYLVK
jgi:hypothetical protein